MPTATLLNGGPASKGRRRRSIHASAPRASTVSPPMATSNKRFADITTRSTSRRSEASRAFEQQGDGSVVDELDLHERLKLTRVDRYTSIPERPN